MLKMMYILIVLEYKFFKYNYDTTLIFFFLETLYVKHSVQGKAKNIYKVVYSYARTTGIRKIFTSLFQPIYSSCVDVINQDRVSLTDQVPGHVVPHVSKANKTNKRFFPLRNKNQPYCTVIN